MPAPYEIVELREGGAVRAALLLAEENGRLRLLTADGREIRVPRDRIVHDTGRVLAPGGPAPERLAAALVDWERTASAAAAGVDLGELREFLAAQLADDPGFDPEALGLGDLATLALGRDEPETRAAVHRALAAPNPWFRFDGRRWQLRPPEEVERELERLRRAEELKAERRSFVEAARARLAGDAVEVPASAAKFLRPVREVAVFGDAATTKKEAAAVLAEIVGPAHSVTQDHAFDVLHRLGLFAADENLALLRAAIRVDFPAPVLEEAAALAARRPATDDRLDLRGLEIVTIDDASTTEIDDGLSFEPTPRGVRLGVHVADPAASIPRGSLVDAEALERATSYYLPRLTIPMLPPVLAEDACSLVQGADRPALSFLIELTPHGEVLRFELRPSLVRVSRRMTYDDCEAALRGEQGPEWIPQVAAIGRELEAGRLAAGAVPIRAPEVVVDFDERGEPLVSLVDPGRPARQLVSEMMILANAQVAAWCRERGVPAIFRRQQAPGSSVPPPPRDRYDPVAVNRFRRAIARTDVSLEPGPHSGLGLPAYLQATSPLRRFQDLAVHRMALASVRGEKLPYTREELTGIAQVTEQAGRQARQVESETDAYWILRVLEKRLGELVAAVVLRTEPRRTHVELLDFAHVFALPPRPDHEPGRLLQLRLRAVKPRRGLLTVEEVGGGR